MLSARNIPAARRGLVAATLLVLVTLTGCGASNRATALGAQGRDPASSASTAAHPGQPSAASPTASPPSPVPTDAATPAPAGAAQLTQDSTKAGAGQPPRGTGAISDGATAPYMFAPQPASSGPSPSTHLVIGDITFVGGQQIVARLTVTVAGSVSLHTFPEAGSSFAVSSLRACVQFTGQSPCAPTSFPSPGYWAITQADLLQHSGYEIHVLATTGGGSSALAGLDIGWDGPQKATMSNLSLPGGCSGATGYQTGCGLRFRVSAATSETVTADPGALHLKVKDKATGQTAYDHTLTGSASVPLPYAAAWTNYLYPESGSPMTLSALSLTWGKS